MTHERTLVSFDWAMKHMLVENADKELIIIEVQNNREIHYLERLLYGASKLTGLNLEQVRKLTR